MLRHPRSNRKERREPKEGCDGPGAVSWVHVHMMGSVCRGLSCRSDFVLLDHVHLATLCLRDPATWDMVSLERQTPISRLE